MPHSDRVPPGRLASVLLAALALGGDTSAQGEIAEVPEEEEVRWQVHLYGNGLGRKDDKVVLDDEGRDTGDFSRIRAIDLELRAEVTEGVDFVLIPRLESDPANTEYSLDVEEAYLGYDLGELLRVDPWSVGVSIGETRTPFGYLNPVRLFDLPQVDRPRALTNFFGEDGYVQMSYRVKVGVPLGSEEQSLDLTFDYLDSGSQPLTFEEGGNVGGNVARVAWTRVAEEGWTWTVGASRLRTSRQDRSDVRATVSGLDFLVGRGRAERSFFIGGEWVRGDLDLTLTNAVEPVGYYAWSQLQLARDWYAGVRFDVSQELDAPQTETETVGAYLTWTQTEDLRYTLFAQTSDSDIPILDGANRVFLEVNFAVGGRPSRPDWMHR